MTEHYEKWVNFLNPVVLRRRILKAGVYLCAYEMLREAVLNPLRDFYANEWTAERGALASERYKECVLSLDPKGKHDAFRASIAWLRENDVIGGSDENDFRALTDARNAFAHEIVAAASLGESPNFEELFPKLRALMIKIDRWWVKNVELSCDEEFAGEDVEVEDITPARMLVLDLMNNAALGNDEEAMRFYNDFLDVIRERKEA